MIWKELENDEQDQAQQVIERILGGPETDGEIIIIACCAAIQSIVVEMGDAEMAEKEIKDICSDLLCSTLKRIIKRQD